VDLTCDGPAVELSVIIVPDTRRSAFPGGLEAFLGQSTGPEAFELVVVDWLSGPSYEPVVDRLRAHPRAPRVVYRRSAGRGRGAMNNVGVAHARGATLCFCADDFVPGPTFVEAHLAFHARCPEPTSVAIGAGLAPDALRDASPFLEWLEDSGELFGVQFRDPAAALPPGYFYIGNASMKRSLVERAGPFDERFEFSAGDDLEYGQRLASLGMRSELVPGARCIHDHPLTLADRREQMSWAGRSSAILAAPSGSPRARAIARARATARVHLDTLRDWGRAARRDRPRAALWRLALAWAFLDGYRRETFGRDGP
jgi:GT2 family glycosyltransferase